MWRGRYTYNDADYDADLLQRPNAKELLKHRFIRNAKKNSSLQELIERYKRWKANGGDSDEEFSDNDVQ